ncbi:MAG: PEP-CTERM sorting domain-containing protein [Deltaproteobacteria bacterium]|nr:PEP-CTERM sorting domain-containing protein [Deltaproteobacteria bacterium]
MRRAILISGWLALLAAAPSAEAAVTTYVVVVTFHEPDTQPNDTIFTGTFVFDDALHQVSNLQGRLTESMTGLPSGGGMNELVLSHQLSSVYDSALGGWLVTAFLNNSTNTLSTLGGGNGWAPGSGYGLYYGYPGANPGNAYVRIFVDTANPLAPATQARINKLAYADCAPGGMMSATCMTGTTVAGYGTIGTMGGYPVSQTITPAPAVPLFPYGAELTPSHRPAAR